MTQTIIKIPAAGAFDPTDITLTDNTSGALLIKEGSNEYMRIDTTNGSELTQFKMPFTTGEFKYMQETSAGSYPFIKCNQGMARLFPGGDGGGFNFNRVEVTTAHVHLTGSGSEVRIGNSLPVSGSGVRAFPASGHSWTELLTTGSTSKIQRVSDGLKMLEVDTDTNATFTLDDASGAVFKVVDDGASPYTYLSATEGENAVRMRALRADSTGTLQVQNATGGLFFEIYQSSFLRRYICPKDSKNRPQLTGSGASQSTAIDFRLGSTKGAQQLQINHGYSGTQTVTLNLNNTLSGFPGNQDWAVNSLLVMVENKTTGQDVAFQIRETTGGTTTFIDHTGASLSDPTGSGSLTLKNLGAASGKNFITFRVTQFNNNKGSASLYDDDRYIVEALTAELF